VLNTHFQRSRSFTFWLALISRSVFVLALLASSALPAWADDDQVYWGAHIPGTPAGPALIDAFEARAGAHASLVQWGESWFHEGAYQPFQTSYFQAVRDRGSIPVLDWGSWDHCCSETQPRFQLSTISNGSHDAFITRWAGSAAAWGHPLFLRFDPEMNGWWRPWNEQVNGNHEGEFVLAWRHVVDIFRAQGASNVTWVWCPNVVGPRSTPMSELYPGHEYVDWVCMDGYNWGTDRNNGWQTFSEVFAGSSYNGGFNTYQLLQDTAPGKPIMIGETASSENGGSKPAWIADMLSHQLPTSFPLVRALVWFDWNEGDPLLHWQIASSPEARKAFRDGIASSYYADNAFASLDGGPIAARWPTTLPLSAAAIASPNPVEAPTDSETVGDDPSPPDAEAP